MKLSRAGALLATFLWAYLALMGGDAMADIAAQGVPGFPNEGQRNFYLHFPLGMALLSVAVLAASWRRGWAAGAGWLAGLLIAALAPYMLFYSGGV